MADCAFCPWRADATSDAASSGRTQRRDFIHLADVVAHWEAAVRYLTRPGSSGASVTFNVASGEAHSVREVADKVVRAFVGLYPNRPVPHVEVVPSPRQGIELVEPSFRVDRSETERLLGLSCRHELDGELPGLLRAHSSAA